MDEKNFPFDNRESSFGGYNFVGQIKLIHTTLSLEIT
jgi:hypothetical protein